MRKQNLILFIIFSFTLLACSLLSNPQDPEVTIKSFMDAMAEQRLDDASALMSPEYRQTYLASCKTATLTECSQKVYQRQGALSYELVDSQVDGNLATITVRARRAQSPQACAQYTLNLVDENWLITSYQVWLCQ